MTQPSPHPQDFARTDSRLVIDPVFRELVGTPYTYLAALAEGGMGRVDLAMRRVGRFSRFYAIKHLHPHLARDDRARAMFSEEGRIGGLLNHPNVVGVTDVGEDAWGPYLVMDFVEGLSLGSLMQTVIQQSELLPIDVALRIGLQIARGLSAIHNAVDETGQALELIHRDLSPRNVLLGFDGSVRITDFGIAKAKNRSVNTTVGMLKGTVGYVAPERLKFEEPTPKSDLFSFGVVLYEVLAGERLYTGTATEAAKEILSGSPPDIGEVRPDVPPAVTDLIFRLLSRDPGERPDSAGDVTLKLERALSSTDEQVELGVFISLIAIERRQDLRFRIEEAVRAASSSSQRDASAAPAAGALPLANSGVVWRNASTGRSKWPLLLTAAVLLVAAAGITLFLAQGRGVTGLGAEADRVQPAGPGAAELVADVLAPRRLNPEPSQVVAAEREDPEAIAPDSASSSSDSVMGAVSPGAERIARRRARRLALRRSQRAAEMSASGPAAEAASVMEPSPPPARMGGTPPQEMTWTGQFR